MTSSNEHTGARLVTKPPSDAYLTRFSDIFGDRPPKRVVFGEEEKPLADEYIKTVGNEFGDYFFNICFENGRIVVYSEKCE